MIISSSKRKLAIIGSRSFSDYNLLEAVLYEHFGETRVRNDLYGRVDAHYSFGEIISGGAAGADSLGAKWAKENNFKLTEFLPDWEKHGKAAGPIRNEDIIKNADFVLSFWDGVSRGTANSLSIAKRLKKSTLIIYF